MVHHLLSCVVLGNDKDQRNYFFRTDLIASQVVLGRGLGPKLPLFVTLLATLRVNYAS